MKQLFKNEDAIAYELKAIATAQNEVQNVLEFLISKEIEPTNEILLQACRKDFSIVVNQFKQSEVAKVEAFQAQFGTMVGMGNTESRINEAGTKLKNELINSVPKISFESLMYIDSFKLVDGSIEMIPNKTDIEAKHTVFADDKELKKIESLCNLLNEVLQQPENEFKALFELFYFNADSKEFEINLGYFDKSDARGWIESRKTMIRQNRDAEIMAKRYN